MPISPGCCIPRPNAVGPQRNPNMSANFLIFNRNKRSVVLDLKTVEGKEALMRLAATCDAFIVNYRPAALAKLGDWTVEIVKRSDQATGFELLPRRWVVERTFAWLNRNRRLAKDFEASIASAKAWLIIASLQLLIRRVAIAGYNHADS